MLTRTTCISLATLVTIPLSNPAWGQVIDEDIMIFANDGEKGDLFGLSTAIGSGVIAVGSPNNGARRVGAVYLYDRVTGNLITKLLANDGAINDTFGQSVAIDNGILAVGSKSDQGTGAVYLFDITTENQIQKFSPNDGENGIQFGASVDIDNGIVVVGARNGSSVYVFEVSTGMQLFKLMPQDTTPSENFGYSVALDNGILVVGANRDSDDGPAQTGSIYLFDINSGDQIAELRADDAEGGNRFGTTVAIHNGVIAVGAPFDNDNGIYSGSAYLFDVKTHVQIAKLLASDGAVLDGLGLSIALDDNFVLVGAPLNSSRGQFSGAAYLYDPSNGEQIAKLIPSNGSQSDQFGHGIAIDNGLVISGAIFSNLTNGSVYGFDLNNTFCQADLDGNEVLNFEDISAFLAAFGAGELAADFNGDGLFNFFDISAFLSAFIAGCP